VSAFHTVDRKSLSHRISPAALEGFIVLAFRHNAADCVVYIRGSHNQGGASDSVVRLSLMSIVNGSRFGPVVHLTI
jgi:hypothetical protein